MNRICNSLLLTLLGDLLIVLADGPMSCRRMPHGGNRSRKSGIVPSQSGYIVTYVVLRERIPGEAKKKHEQRNKPGERESHDPSPFCPFIAE